MRGQRVDVVVFVMIPGVEMAVLAESILRTLLGIFFDCVDMLPLLFFHVLGLPEGIGLGLFLIHILFDWGLAGGG